MFKKIRMGGASMNKQANSGTKYVHISLDDVIEIFRDLTLNSGCYESMFENPTLAYLKNLHDKYGAVVSLYCFNSHGSHSLRDTTTKFRSEFQASKDWLKFGHHHSGYDESYESGTAIQSAANYTEFVDSIMNITGDCECIDRVPRLHRYAGSLESIIAMRDCPCGLMGMLGADDDRQNYYLTAEQGAYALAHERFYDSVNQLTVFTTDLRMEWIDDVDHALMDLRNSSWGNKANDLIIFTHEQLLDDETKAKLERCCQYAADNGYAFEFPMNILFGYPRQT